MRSIALCLPALAILSCASTSQDGPARILAQKVHAAFMERSPDYQQIGFGKAMSACVIWPKTMSRRPRPVFRHYVSMDPGSDGQYPPSFLARETLQVCSGVVAEHNLPCTCQIIDQDGKNMVQVPAPLASALTKAKPSLVTAYDPLPVIQKR